MTMEAWTITQLKLAMDADLEQCSTEFERINVRAFGGMEIRRAADRWSRIRKLGPCEVAIAESFGWTI
jgi:hypothetical protein